MKLYIAVDEIDLSKYPALKDVELESLVDSSEADKSVFNDNTYIAVGLLDDDKMVILDGWLRIAYAKKMGIKFLHCELLIVKDM